MNKIRNNKAFTLIELIVVVGIIGILVGIASPRFTGYTEKAKVAKYTSNGKALENTAEVFNIKNEKFPRLSEVAYTADEVNNFSETVRDLSGEEVTLDVDGKYYDLDYLAINDSISIPNNQRANYILQNPKGKVYYLEGLTEEGLMRDDFDSTNPNNNSSNKEQVEDSEIIKIENARQLARVGKDGRYPLDGKYIQTRDIDLSGYEWDPIGSIDNKFTGIFDGGNYKISNLTANQDNNYVGLFGYIESASLKNIHLTNINVKGVKYVGGLVGAQKHSNIVNSLSEGSIRGFRYVGGLIGRQINSRILNSGSEVNISGGVDPSVLYSYIGGLVGAQNGSIIENSYSSGSISSTGSEVGGLAGKNILNSEIKNSYSSTSVVSTDKNVRIGGLVGVQYRGSSVKNSYAVGKVTAGDGGTGGLIGVQHTNSNVIESYYNKETTNQSLSSGGKGLITKEMKQKKIYKGWDFSNIWTIDSNQYPTLQWENK